MGVNLKINHEDGTSEYVASLDDSRQTTSNQKHARVFSSAKAVDEYEAMMLRGRTRYRYRDGDALELVQAPPQVW